MRMSCEVCGEPLTTPDAQRFCSRACANRRQSPRVIRSCEQCGQTFAVKPYKLIEGRGHYCSRTCYLAVVKPAARLCDRCGKPIPQTSWSHEARFCSQACYHAHPRPVGEISHARTYNTFFQRQRLLALERDAHRCLTCGATADLVVHHREPYRISRSHALGNLQTLCRRCHRLADHAYQMAERLVA